MTDATVHLLARLIPKAGQGSALKDAITAIVPQVLTEPGCIAYIAHESLDTPGVILMVEAWADQAALDAHAIAPALRSLAARFDALLAEPVHLERMRRL
ncbi:MAG: putative quinol monooxygenase [Sphingobium sp.]